MDVSNDPSPPASPNLLDCRSDRTNNNGKVESEWLAEAMRFLVSQSLLLLVGDAWNSLEVSWILCDLCALLQEI